MEEFIGVLAIYVFFYPLIMSLFWVAGSILFTRRWEKRIELDFDNTDWPMISILIPCYNEEDTIEETIALMQKIAYKNKEIIAVNDGSQDRTGEILHRLAKLYDNLRVIDCKENRGKATALKLATFASRAEYLICVDSDAVLDPYAAHYLIYHFFHHDHKVFKDIVEPWVKNSS